ncbi:MAG: hemolysin III family protein [Coriobacteriia bacterium]|nr:hemolysin III family protein [Coriobacteriia bacterium]
MTGQEPGESGTSQSTARGEKRPSREYTVGEEIANSVTHGIGVAFSLVATTLLIAFAALYGDNWAMGSGIAFGLSLILLYTGSTLYHAIPNPRARHVFKIMDHAAIYLLIAGSYTPFCIVTIRDRGGWWMFAIVWTLAFAGIATEAFWAYRPRWLSAVVYLCMGWMVVFMFGPVSESLASNGLWLLVAGGLCYTLGTIFYVAKRVPYFHMVWHLWVLAGSVCHFLAVLLYVMPSVKPLF